jgi:hypothetical protein
MPRLRHSLKSRTIVVQVLLDQAPDKLTANCCPQSPRRCLGIDFKILNKTTHIVTPTFSVTAHPSMLELKSGFSFELGFHKSLEI